MLQSLPEIGKNHIHLHEVTSTNDYAIELIAKSNPQEGTVVSADYQTHGKGQFDRIWSSSKGENILMSVILYPKFLEPTQQNYLSMTITNAINQYLKAHNLSSQAKLPNDIYIEGKKICGMLIVNQITYTQINVSIIGIGININQEDFGILENATSLKKLTKNKYDLSQEKKKLFTYLTQHYHRLILKKFDVIKEEFDGFLIKDEI